MPDVIRANISRPYLIRLGMVSLFSLGLAFWCVYDGLVTYPNQIARAEAYIGSLDNAIQPIRPDAESASQSLTVPVSPDQWDSTRWNQVVTKVLDEQKDATTTDQNQYFLQISWLYLTLKGKLQNLESTDDPIALSRYLQI